MPVLQYILEEAYSGNTHINCFKDGKKVGAYIVSDWALPGYLDCLENEGYEKAYDIEKYRREWEEAKENEKTAREAYFDAMKKPLYK